MKKRSMILALASMLGVSAAATAVSGFAWFTAQTTASIVGGTYKVGAANGNLKIGAVTDNDINCSSAKSDSTLTVTPTASAAFADVSSIDGKNFYKLKNMDLDAHTADFVTELDGTENAADKVWMSKVNTTQMVCVSWSMTVENSGSEPTMNVYLSHNGDLFEDNESGDHGTTEKESTNSYVDAYRLAIFDGTSLVYMYAKTTHGLQAADGNNGAFVYDETGKWDGTGEIAKSATTASQILNTSTIPADDTKTVSDASSQLLISGLSTSAHTLKFVVWCEGTDTPEKEIDTANSVKLAFDLVGLTA